MVRCVFPIIALSIALAMTPAIARGEPPRKTAAQTLFYEARALMQDGKYGEACPKLEESDRLEPGIGTQFNLADCNEHIGKLATAWAGFLDVATQAKAANQSERERLARRRAAALEPRLPRVVVDVSEGADQPVEVKRNGVRVGAALWGTPIPVDPGVQHITASAPGKQTWEATVHTTEAKTSRVTVPRELVPAPVALPSVAPPAIPSASSTASAPSTPSTQGLTTTTSGTPDTALAGGVNFPPPIVEERGEAQRAAGWIVAGVGLAGIGVGAGFGLLSISKRDQSREHCNVDACDSTGVSLRDDAIHNGNIATVAVVAGGAAALGGILLVLTAPRNTPPETAGKLRATPVATAGGAGFALHGVFP